MSLLLLLAGAGSGLTNYEITLDAGSYTITGHDVTLTVARQITLDAGSYTVSGLDVALTVDRQIALDAGAYTVTGKDATLSVSRLLELDAGAYVVTGKDAALTVARLIELDTGSYTITGLDLVFDYSGEIHQYYTVSLVTNILPDGLLFCNLQATAEIEANITPDAEVYIG